jgi:hypothetical protein
MLVLVFGGLALSLLLSSTDPATVRILIYAAKLYSVLWYIALYTLFWNFVDGYFDILDAKRLFSLLSAGSALGAALGGAAVSLLVDYIKVEELLLIWSALALLGLPVAIACRKNWQRLEVEDLDNQVQQSLGQQTKSLFKTFKNSNFALILGSTLFFTMIVTLICEYQYSAVFAKQHNEAELAKLFGTLFFCVHVINLFTNLFVFNRLVLLFGVRNMALVQPICYAATFIFFLLDNSYYAGIVGFFAYHGMLTSIDYNNTNLLLNALPTESKKQLRTFIEGVCEPMANAFAGAFLIFVAFFLSPIQISSVGLVLAGLCLLLVLALRSAYLQSMVANLKLGWLDFSSPQKESLLGLDALEISLLKQRAVYSEKDSEAALEAIDLLISNDSASGLCCLLSLIEKAPKSLQKQASPLLSKILAEQDNQNTQHILIWVESNYEKLDPTLLETLGKFGLISIQKGLNLQLSSSAAIKAASAVILRSSRDIHLTMKSLQTLDSLLSSNESDKVAAIGAIGNLGLEEYAHFLLPYANSENQAISIQALASIEKLVSSQSVRLVAELLKLFTTLQYDERQVCLRIFKQIADANCISVLLQHSEKLTPAERRKIEDVLLSIGLKSTPTSLSILRDQNYSYKARSIAARSIAKLSFPQLEAISQDLIKAEIYRAYEFISFELLLSKEAKQLSGLRVLKRFYQDSKNNAIEFVLELLTLSGKLANFEMIAASLKSDNKKDRGNAIETVQEACSREINHLLLPLLTAQHSADKVKFFRNKFAHKESNLSQILDNAIQSNFVIESAAAMQAIWELADNQSELDSVALTLTKKLHRADKLNQICPLLLDTIVSLRCRESRNDTGTPTPIEKLAVFLKLDLFSAFSIQDLSYLAETAELNDFEKSTKICKLGDKADTLFIIISGELSTSGPSQSKIIDAPNVIGEESLLGQRIWNQEIDSLGCQIMQVSLNNINLLAKANVNIAKSLLTKKLEQTSIINSYFENSIDQTEILDSKIVHAELEQRGQL